VVHRVTVTPASPARVLWHLSHAYIPVAGHGNPAFARTLLDITHHQLSPPLYVRVRQFANQTICCDEADGVSYLVGISRLQSRLVA